MTREMLFKKLLISALLLLIAAVSAFILAEKASSMESFQGTIASIDQKTKHVLELSASSALISTGISALPGDTASPIAEKLADFTGYFLLILCVLYAEKNALAILGIAVFRFAIPIACALCIAGQFLAVKRLPRFAWKLAVFALVVFAAIPISLKVSDAIYENHKSVIETTLAEADQMREKTAQLTEAEGNDSLISSILGGWKETVSGFLSKGAQIVNRFVESIAIFIVTTCVMPLLMLAFLLWMAKLLLGIQLDPSRLRKNQT